jgi:cation transport regulator
MSENYNNYLWQQIFTELLQSRLKIVVSKEFHKQVEQIDLLLSNDKTGIVSTIVEFMIQSATTNFQFESGNDTLDAILKGWTNQLNLGISQDIPTGLRPLTQQYLRERWRSSFIALNVNWEKKDDYYLPSEMWLTDGKSVYVDGTENKLGGYVYSIGKEQEKKLITNANKSILIRKPYNAWFDKYPTPYLIKKGALYHALVKNELVSRQSDVINSIIPHILAIKAGNDTFAKAGEMPTKPELEALKEQVKEMADNYRYSREKGGNYGAFPYDVTIENIIPDLTKILNDTIVSPSNKNLLFALGLVELEGFSSTRQEAILNPKVLVEEVKNAVNDWADLLEDVLFLILEKNKKAHPKVANSSARVVPGTVKAFMTNDMRVMLRSLFDRGTIGHQDILENTTDLDFQISFNRRKKEQGEINDVLYPHIIQNLENDIRDIDPLKNNSPEQKKSEKDISASLEDADTKEIENYLNLGRNMEYLQAPYENVDQLPDAVKNHLPIPAQLIFLRVVNQALKDGKSESDAFRLAWGVVKKTFRPPQGNEKKWQKKEA